MVENAPAARRAEFVTDSPEATRDLARRLGELCRGGETLFLHGDLGSGKTCFVQGLARGLGLPPDMRVTSPTFTVHAEYPGRLVLNHLDLYRLEEASALTVFGIEDMLADPGAVTAVEWPELLAESLGDIPRLDVRLEDCGEGRRKIVLAAGDPAHIRLVPDAPPA